MQIDLGEIRAWAGLLLSYIVALCAAGTFLWKVFVRKINAVAEALRAERDKEATAMAKDARITAESCIRHGVRIDEQERRIIQAEGDNKSAIYALAEIGLQLRGLGTSIEALRAAVNDEDKAVAGRLGSIEAKMEMVLRKNGLP